MGAKAKSTRNVVESPADVTAKTVGGGEEVWPKGTLKALTLKRADKMLNRLCDANTLRKKHATEFGRFAAMEKATCQADPLYWLSNYAWTVDEHDRDHPIKPFPVELPWVPKLVWAYSNIPVIALVKSRQEMATWFFCLLDLWDTLFNPGARTVFQSEKEDKAAALIERCAVCYRKQPEWLVPKATFNVYDVQVPANNATILSVPTGVRQVAGYTLRNIFFDECNALEDFGECVGVAGHCVRDGGRLHAVGTAAPGDWEAFWKGVDTTED